MAVILLVLLEINERTACDLVFEVVRAGVPMRQRTRRLAERALREHPETVAVRWALLARHDRDELERRVRR